jgi:hypothetical protein
MMKCEANNEKEGKKNCSKMQQQKEIHEQGRKPR